MAHQSLQLQDDGTRPTRQNHCIHGFYKGVDFLRQPVRGTDPLSRRFAPHAFHAVIIFKPEKNMNCCLLNILHRFRLDI
jgi:hypothetical protein